MKKIKLIRFVRLEFAEMNFCLREVKVSLLFVLLICSHFSKGQCLNLLNDLRPDAPSDSTLEVYLRFYVMTPPGTGFNNGLWTQTGNVTTLADAEIAVAHANKMLALLDTVQLSVPGVAQTTDSRIRLKIKSFEYVSAHQKYYNRLYDSLTHGQKYFPYKDSTVVNVFVAGPDSTFYSSCAGNNAMWLLDASYRWPATYPANYIFLCAEGPSHPSWANLSEDNGEHYGKTIAHEFCHVMGLPHSMGQYTIIGSDGNPLTVLSQGYAYIVDDWGCCDTVYSNDYVLETHLAFENCRTPGGSNNLMSSNVACNKYLSPQQLATMHYNLRTKMRWTLTPRGFKNAITANELFNYQVTSNETWTTDRYMKGNVIIEPGKKLTIQCGVAMTNQGKIIVRPGAQLVVDGGKITNISGTVWNGIQVAGVYNKDQSYNASTGFATHQGILWLKNGAILEHGENTVQNYTNTATGVDWASIGGIILADNANFLNNWRDVEFLQYTYTSSKSRFIKCNFNTTGRIGWDTYYNETTPHVHVSIWNNSGIQFKGCKFDFSAKDLAIYSGITNNNGINSIDASYTMEKISSTPCSFKNFSQGVLAINSNPLKTINIYDAVFQDNVVDAVNFFNMNSFVLDNNLVSLNSSVNAANGFYFNSCKGYNVKNNTFIDSLGYYHSNTGIIPYNSRGGFVHQIYRNTFKGTQVGIKCVDNNSGISNNINGLRMNCNVFGSGGENNFVDIGLLRSSSPTEDPTVMTYQGKFVTPINQGDQERNCVRNIYGAVSSCNGCENQFYIQDTSAKTVVHVTDSNYFARPVPQPALSDIDVSVQNALINIEYSTDCPASPSNNGGAYSSRVEQLSNLNDYLNFLEGKDLEEAQLTQLSKLNIFLTDTLDASRDSVYAILSENRAGIDDADILAVFAAMNKGDFDGAEDLRTGLGTGREDWKNLFEHLIYFGKHPDVTYDLQNHSTEISFLEGFITKDYNDGFGSALALLRGFNNFSSYSDPRPVLPPFGSGGSRLMSTQSIATETATGIHTISKIIAYPNPASESMNLEYPNYGNCILQVVLTDAIGRKVYEGETKSDTSLHTIPLTGVKNGVYFLNVYEGKSSIYQTKVICMH